MANTGKLNFISMVQYFKSRAHLVEVMEHAEFGELPSYEEIKPHFRQVMKSLWDHNQIDESMSSVDEKLNQFEEQWNTAEPKDLYKFLLEWVPDHCQRLLRKYHSASYTFDMKLAYNAAGCEDGIPSYYDMIMDAIEFIDCDIVSANEIVEQSGSRLLSATIVGRIMRLCGYKRHRCQSRDEGQRHLYIVRNAHLYEHCSKAKLLQLKIAHEERSDVSFL